METKIWILILSLLAGLSTQAQFLRDPARPVQPAYAQFFHQRFDSWFQMNIYNFESSFSPEEKKLWQDFKTRNSQFGLEINSSFVRAYSYSVVVDLMNVKSHHISFLNLSADPQINQQIDALLKKKAGMSRSQVTSSEQIGLKWSSNSKEVSFLYMEKNPLKLTQVQIVKGKITGRSSWSFNISSSENCLGVMDITQRDLFTDAQGRQILYCHSQRFEPEALGPATEKINLQFRQAWNLQIGQLARLPSGDYELIYP